MNKKYIIQNMSLLFTSLIPLFILQVIGWQRAMFKLEIVTKCFFGIHIPLEVMCKEIGVYNYSSDAILFLWATLGAITCLQLLKQVLRIRKRHLFFTMIVLALLYASSFAIKQGTSWVPVLSWISYLETIHPRPKSHYNFLQLKDSNLCSL